MSSFATREHFPDTSLAADLILPHLFAVAGRFESAVDVGGGTGAWAAALKRLGVSSVRCVDDPELSGADLLVDPSEFVGCDLVRDLPAPLYADLVLCLEVAEHLPACRSEALVEYLTSCGGTILFSAAIPGQPSPSHINEQPPEYWRGLFSRRGFARFDCVRPRVIADRRIPYWYRQNIFVFASGPEARARGLASLPVPEVPEDFELVHSSVLERYRSPRPPRLRDVPGIVERSLRTRLGRV